MRDGFQLLYARQDHATCSDGTRGCCCVGGVTVVYCLLNCNQCVLFILVKFVANVHIWYLKNINGPGHMAFSHSWEGL